MDKFLINGPCKIKGNVSISGSKNSSLPILAATLLFDKPVVIDEKVIKKLEEAIKTNYHRYFCPDGFFWGQQFQEESMREYREQDEEFLKECKEALELG